MNWRAIFLVFTIIAMGYITTLYANGRYGGENPDTINDVGTPVRNDEAAIRFALTTAEQWDAEDHKTCRGSLGLYIHPMTYARCMTRRSNTRILYMLRQNCVGLNASVCKENIQ